MTATAIHTGTTTNETTRPLWRTGARAGVTAAVATTAVAVAARAVDIPLDAAGESIPILGFAQLTLVCTAIGVLIAKGVRRFARRPRSVFTAVTVALTVLSFVPDITLDTGAASKLVLMLTHVVAAAIVIPALAGRLAEDRSA